MSRCSLNEVALRYGAPPPHQIFSVVTTLNLFTVFRSVHYPEGVAAGIRRVFEGEGEGACERAWHVQRVQCLPGGSAENRRGRRAHGDGQHSQRGRGNAFLLAEDL